jgi:hypothetical protein
MHPLALLLHFECGGGTSGKKLGKDCHGRNRATCSVYHFNLTALRRMESFLQSSRSIPPHSLFALEVRARVQQPLVFSTVAIATKNLDIVHMSGALFKRLERWCFFFIKPEEIICTASQRALNLSRAEESSLRIASVGTLGLWHQQRRFEDYPANA